MTHHQIIDWEHERGQYPVCKRFVYYMSSANAPLSKSVYRAQREVLDLLHEDAHTSWEGVNAKGMELRQDLATLYGGKAHDWGFGANTSHNMNLIALSLKNAFGPLNVLSFKDEFPSSTIPWEYHGHEVHKVDHQENGRLSLEYIIENLQANTKVVVLSHVQYSTGFRADIEGLGRELNRRGIFFIINATQSLGIHPINLAACKASALICSSHKWLGAGYGASLLYTSKEWRDQIRWPLAGTLSFQDPSFSGALINAREGTPFIELGAMPFMQLMGIAASVKEIMRLGAQNIQERALKNTKYLCHLLQENSIELIYNTELWQPQERSQIILLKFQNPAQVLLRLREQNILVNERANKLRVSVNSFNNQSDAAALVNALQMI